MNTYETTTLAYGAVALLALVFVPVAWAKGNWILLVVCILAVYVALDNFFCGYRARRHGHDIRGHYVIPPFLKKKDINRS